MTILRKRQEKKLLAVLSAHGAKEPWVPADTAWTAFKEYARSVASGDGNGLLFQVGTFDFEGRPGVQACYCTGTLSLAGAV